MGYFDGVEYLEGTPPEVEPAKPGPVEPAKPGPVEPAGGKILFEEFLTPLKEYRDIAAEEVETLREAVRKLHEAQRAQEQEILELQKLAPIGPMELVRYALARLRMVIQALAVLGRRYGTSCQKRK